MLLATNLVRSRMGRALGAVNDSEVAAECLGVDTFALRLRVFVLAAGYAGLAGVFYAHWLGVVSPEAAGFELSVELLLMVVLGGLERVGCADRRHRRQRHGRGGEDLITALIPGASGEVQLLAFGVVLVLVIILVPAASPSSGTSSPRRELHARRGGGANCRLDRVHTFVECAAHAHDGQPTGRAARGGRPPRAGIAAAGRAT